MDYLLAIAVLIGCVIGGVVAKEIYSAHKKLPDNKITNEALALMDDISNVIEKEVRIYIASLEGRVIKINEIDDIIIELFFIVRSAIGEGVINRINEINLKEIGDEIDLDGWIKNVVTYNVKKILGRK